MRTTEVGEEKRRHAQTCTKAENDTVECMCERFPKHFDSLQVGTNLGVPIVAYRCMIQTCQKRAGAVVDIH